MAVKAALTYSWPSGLARLRQFATTICAPSNLSRKSIALDLTERVVISVMFSHFAFRSLRSFTQSSDIETLLLLFSELLPFLFILLRKPSATLSDKPLDWFFGFAGTTAVLLITPATVDPLIWRSACLAIILLGIFTQVSAKVALGLSFGIVAANRGVRVEGPYRLSGIRCTLDTPSLMSACCWLCPASSTLCFTLQRSVCRSSASSVKNVSFVLTRHTRNLRRVSAIDCCRSSISGSRGRSRPRRMKAAHQAAFLMAARASSAAFASLVMRRTISPAGKISSMLPALCPAVRQACSMSPSKSRVGRMAL